MPLPELVNYPGYKLLPDGRVWSNKTQKFLKLSDNGTYNLSRYTENKVVQLTTLQYEQTHQCKYDHIIQTLYLGKEVFLFQCKLKWIPYKIYRKRFKTLKEALLYKYFFILRTEAVVGFD